VPNDPVARYSGTGADDPATGQNKVIFKIKTKTTNSTLFKTLVEMLGTFYNQRFVRQQHKFIDRDKTSF
jgi:hypothetical protein